MANYTEKQQRFVAAKAAGKKNREAALEAGYAGTNAGVIASKMMTLPHIKAAIAKAKRAEKRGDSEDDVMPKAHYADMLEMLLDVANNPKLSMSMRTRAAEQVLPYQHARIGEKGKKEKKTDDAKGVTKTTKFTPKRPPALFSVK